MNQPCPGCGQALVTRLATEKHNRACAESGERAYPKFPPLILPSGKLYDPNGYRDLTPASKRSYVGRRT